MPYSRKVPQPRVPRKTLARISDLGVWFTRTYVCDLKKKNLGRDFRVDGSTPCVCPTHDSEVLSRFLTRLPETPPMTLRTTFAPSHHDESGLHFCPPFLTSPGFKSPGGRGPLRTPTRTFHHSSPTRSRTLIGYWSGGHRGPPNVPPSNSPSFGSSTLFRCNRRVSRSLSNRPENRLSRSRSSRRRRRPTPLRPTPSRLLSLSEGPSRRSFDRWR